MQEQVTIIMPVSRSQYLSRVFTGLEMLNCERSQTNLFVIVDGDDDLFVETRNFVSSSKFTHALCVPYSKRGFVPETILERRQKIADIHNEIKSQIGLCKYILGTEDDTVLSPNALKILLNDFALEPNAGFIEGVELGRWNKPYVGAWTADDIYEPTVITSMLPSNDDVIIEPIDAGGFYCFMSKRDLYISHEFKTFQDNSMGADAEYGMRLRELGYSNYIDWRLNCEHLTGEESISLKNVKPIEVSFRKRGKTWSFYSK